MSLNVGAPASKLVFNSRDMLGHILTFCEDDRDLKLVSSTFRKQFAPAMQTQARELTSANIDQMRNYKQFIRAASLATVADKMTRLKALVISVPASTIECEQLYLLSGRYAELTSLSLTYDQQSKVPLMNLVLFCRHKLENLRIHHKDLVAGALIDMARCCKKLKSLELMDCQQFTSPLFERLFFECPALESLKFSKHIDLPVDCVDVFQRHGARVKSLDICDTFSDEQWVHIAGYCPNLTSLGLRVKNADAAYRIAISLKNLEQLKIYSDYHDKDVTEPFLTHCLNLRSVFIKEFVTPEMYDALSRLPHLTHLNLDVANIDSDRLVQFVKNARNLIVLEFNFLNVSKGTLRAIKKINPKLVLRNVGLSGAPSKIVTLPNGKIGLAEWPTVREKIVRGEKTRYDLVREKLPDHLPARALDLIGDYEEEDKP